jgi:hypothetical protein
MAWSYQAYLAAGLGISFGFPILIFAVLLYLIYRCPKTFYRMIESMFSIKHNEVTTSEGRESIDLYGVLIDLPATIRGFVPRFALILMATAILTATLMLFFSGLILITEYVPSNSKCPSQGEMDCYTIMDNTYFYCNSSDTRVDASLGSLICYRWVKENIGTVDVLNQIGLCGGLIQAFGWFVNIFLRALLHMLQRKKKSVSAGELMTDMYVVNITSRRRRLFKMCFKHLVVILIALTPCVALIVLGAKNISRTGITMIILSSIFFVAVSGILLFFTYENEKFKHDNIAFMKSDTIPVSVPEMAKKLKQDTTKEGTEISITRIVSITH